MFGFFHDEGFPPVRDKVAYSGPKHNCQAQPCVVGHEDEHKEVGKGQLYHVKNDQ